MAIPSIRRLPELGVAVEPPIPAQPPETGALLEQLAQALDRQGVPYCQWKGHWSAHRWAMGNGDLDLLVDHAAMPAFRQVLQQLGFKVAYPSGARQIPGVEHYFGLDPAVHRLLHLHVHYRLLLGDYWRRIYRIPVERQLFDQSVAGRPFRVPSPTHQFFVFVLRMMLRQVGRPLLSAQTRWLGGIQVPLVALEAESKRDELASLLDQLGSIDLTFFDRCVRSLTGRSGALERVLLPWELHWKLRAHVRRPSLKALGTAALEKLLPTVAAYLVSNRMRTPRGGLVVALVGGDGAGKSTCARELDSWLGAEFPSMRAHLGNPPKTVLTLIVGAALKLQQRLTQVLNRTSQHASSLELTRYLCTARDRYRLYVKARRFAVAGGIAICERYPIPQNRLLVGPVIQDLLPSEPHWLAEQLRLLEASYYRQMVAPDLLCVLRLEPELAVIRKWDEPADYVRARGRVVWETDWARTAAHVVDASQPLPDVIARLRAIIWSNL